jgi:glycerophosphoryl diester phosphodiesterase
LGLHEPDFIEHAQALGLVVHFWTIDRPETMQALIAAGADGVMTNHPDRLASVLRGRPR